MWLLFCLPFCIHFKDFSCLFTNKSAVCLLLICADFWIYSKDLLCTMSGFYPHFLPEFIKFQLFVYFLNQLFVYIWISCLFTFYFSWFFAYLSSVFHFFQWYLGQREITIVPLNSFIFSCLFTFQISYLFTNQVSWLFTLYILYFFACIFPVWCLY